MRREIEPLLTDFVRAYPKTRGTRTVWKDPLIACAAADDPLFGRLRKVAGPTHALPRELLPGARAVIAFFLPFDEPVARSNIGGRYSSARWADAYAETNRLIHDLCLRLQGHLEGSGYRSTVIPATRNFDPVRLASDWSHRHVAYVAGLGRFGIHNMLITEQGCCGRLGSVVTDCPLEPTPRAGCEYCLFKRDGSCGRCADRCVNQALTVTSFDRRRCYAMCLENAARQSAGGRQAGPEGPADICGKCLVGVPCSFRNPSRAKAPISGPGLQSPAPGHPAAPSGRTPPGPAGR